MSTIFRRAYAEDRTAMTAFRIEVAAHPPIRFAPETRPVFDALMAQTPPAKGVVHTSNDLGKISGSWCRPRETTRDAALLYLHGGAHVLGSAEAYRNFVGQIASRTGLTTFTPNYRLAPEHPFPADLDDARAAYDALVEAGFRKIVVAGDSAGGGLALSLIAEASMAARRGVGQRPAAAVVVSPWTDLSLASPSLEDRAAADPLLSRDSLAAAVDQYLGAHSRIDPRASPMFGALAGLPPTLIHVGEDEVLLDDARRYASAAEAAGSEVTLHVWEAMTHVFPSSVAFLRAAGEALDDMGTFVRAAVEGAGA